MVDLRFMIVQNLRMYLTAVTLTAVTLTAVVPTADQFEPYWTILNDIEQY